MDDRCILIVGIGGFVGGALAHALVTRGEHVIGTCRSVPAGLPPGVRLYSGPEAMDYGRLLPGCRAVVHAASTSTPGLSAGKALAEVDDNLRPTVALVEAMQVHAAIPVLYLSSGGALYDGSGSQESGEGDPVAPRSYHGAGKVAAEHFLRAWAEQYGAAATVLRPSNLYGPGQRERDGFGVVPAAFGRMLRDETLPVWGDGSTQRDYLYIEDFVRLCMLALDRPQQGFRVFNACSGSTTSLDALLAIMEAVAGRTLHRRYVERRSVDASVVRMSAERAQRLLGWNARWGLRDGLERTWRWFTSVQP
jgi:UDP-glucose 4-epimerase